MSASSLRSRTTWHRDLEKGWDELGAIGDEVANVETGAPAYMRRTYRKALREVERGSEES